MEDCRCCTQLRQPTIMEASENLKTRNDNTKQNLAKLCKGRGAGRRRLVETLFAAMETRCQWRGLRGLRGLTPSQRGRGKAGSGGSPSLSLTRTRRPLASGPSAGPTWHARLRPASA
eukprot:884623-Rhodomonas_salina.3